ncbi:MAG: hypothetical protein ACR2H0_04975 [Candidatus Limnocylindrales bacterium]
MAVLSGDSIAAAGLDDPVGGRSETRRLLVGVAPGPPARIPDTAINPAKTSTNTRPAAANWRDRDSRGLWLGRAMTRRFIAPG